MQQPPEEFESAQPPSGERLHKVLAAAGIGSRRQCEELILAGRVQVDGQTITALGVRVDPQRQRIAVDTVDIARPRLAYYAVNKPVGVVCTNSDPQGRTRVIDLLPAGAERVYTVGRLDRNSEGLVLLTNDGELANRLMHPRYEVAKVYDVQVAGDAGRDLAAQLLRGVHLAEGRARASRVQIKSHHGRSTVLRITLQEGRNREIRRLLARTGHKVMQLRRVSLGPLRLQALAPGAYRRLDDAEVRALRQAAFTTERQSRDEPSDAQETAAVSPPLRRDGRRPATGQRRPPRERRYEATGRPPRRAPGRGPGPRPFGKPSGGKPVGGRRGGAGAEQDQRQRQRLGELGVILGEDESAPAERPPRGKRFRPARGAAATGRTARPDQAGRPPRRRPTSGEDSTERPPGKHRKFAGPKTGGKKFAGKKFAGKKATGKKFAGQKFSGGQPGGKPSAGKRPGGPKRPGGGKPGGKRKFGGKKPRGGRPG